MNKWTKICRDANICATIVPLAFETFGFLDPDFRDFLLRLTTIAGENQGGSDAAKASFRRAFFPRALALVAFAAQRGNAEMLDTALSQPSYRQQSYFKRHFDTFVTRFEKHPNLSHLRQWLPQWLLH